MYKYMINIWCLMIIFTSIIIKFDSSASVIEQNENKFNIQVEKEENKIAILKSENQVYEKKEYTEKQKEVLKASETIISGNSSIFGEVKNISIYNYIDRSCNYFEFNYDIELDRYLFLALLYQESKCNPNIENGIAQITNNETIELNNIVFKVSNRKDAVSSIDWTIANYIRKYLVLSEYRNSTVSKWYILKLHNSGNALQDVRFLYKDKYPLTESGDEEFLKDLEAFDNNGKNMFKKYLIIIGSNYCMDINSKITEDSSYEDYTSSGKLFSDPKYLENIKEYYLN